MAALKRAAIQLGANSEFCLTKFRAFNAETASTSSSSLGRFSYRQISQLVKTNGKRACLVDTLALVRSLEAQGVPSKQAEAITSAMTEVLNDSLLENVAHSFVSKAEMQKVEMLQESNLSKFKSEVQSSQEHHFSLLQRETEKLRGDIEKMHSELRYEIDKVTAVLGAQLEAAKYDVGAQLEAAKYDVFKYCIGTLVSISAVGLAVIRILM